MGGEREFSRVKEGRQRQIKQEDGGEVKTEGGNMGCNLINNYLCVLK